LSQLYQVAEDGARGDHTFARTYGPRGVKRAFLVLFPLGAAGLVVAFGVAGPRWMSAGLALGGPLLGVFLWCRLRGLQGQTSEYGAIMRLKYATSALFVTIVLAGLLIRRG
jgi:hypothetical protein